MPDLIGYGKSQAWRGAGPFHFHADLAAMRELALSLGEPFALVGHSYGGLLALQLAATLPPGRVHALVVYEPVAWGVAYETGDDAALQSFIDAGFFDDARGGSAEWMGGFVDFWGGAGTWEALGEPGRAQMLKASRKTFEEVRALCFDFTPPSAYAALGCPTLILCGSESPSIEQRVCERLAEAISGAERQVVAGAGHLAESLRGFLQLRKRERRRSAGVLLPPLQGAHELALGAWAQDHSHVRASSSAITATKSSPCPASSSSDPSSSAPYSSRRSSASSCSPSANTSSTSMPSGRSVGSSSTSRPFRTRALSGCCMHDEGSTAGPRPGEPMRGACWCWSSQGSSERTSTPQLEACAASTPNPFSRFKSPRVMGPRSQHIVVRDCKSASASGSVARAFFNTNQRGARTLMTSGRAART